MPLVGVRHVCEENAFQAWSDLKDEPEYLTASGKKGVVKAYSKDFFVNFRLDQGGDDCQAAEDNRLREDLEGKWDSRRQPLDVDLLEVVQSQLRHKEDSGTRVQA